MSSLALANHDQGAPYKFGVSVESKGFDEAPDCVLKAIQRLDWAAKVAIDSTMKMLPFLPHPGQDSPPGERRAYNELLILGYMEKDQINVSFSKLKRYWCPRTSSPG